MNLHAQGIDNKLLPVITLPSPEAASLGKYGAWPVSQYTGIPNISIPVYNININGYSLPVNLNYHAGGVKIDDKASWVGTNWSLSAGGAITRTVVGLPDDDINYGFATRFKFGSRLKDSYNLTTDADYSFFLLASKNNLDVQADAYYYNFAGHSGKILVDSNFNVRTIPASNLKFLITPFSYLLPNSPPIGSPQWVIADAAGNIYKFGVGNEGMESTNVRDASGQVASQGVTALYLVQIITANKGDTINFDYGEKSEYYALPYTQSVRGIEKVYPQFQGFPNPPPTTSPANGCATYNDMFNANEVLFNGARVVDGPRRSYTSVWGQSQLQTITWRGGQISFKAATQRQDMNSITGRMLDSINVFNHLGTRIKSTRLEYAYVNGRYYLDSLKETGNTAAAPLKYGFAYYNRNSLPPGEPQSSGSGLNPNSQDHWGFFNGKPNESLIPFDPRMPGPSHYRLTSDRNSDSIAMRTGTLTRVTYPTGGFTDFNYEANIYDPANLANPPQGEIVEAMASAAMHFQQPVGRTTVFTLPFNQSSLPMYVQFNDYAHPPNKNDAVFPYVKLAKQTSPGVFQTVYYWDAYNNFPSGTVTPNSRGFYDFVINTSVILDAGTYHLVVNDSCPRSFGPLGPGCLEANYPDPDPEDDIWIIPLSNARVTYQTYAPSGALQQAGGLRIKEMLNYTENNVLAGRKRYEYDPGSLLMTPGYMRLYDRYIGVNGVSQCYGMARLKEMSSTSQSMLGFTQGSAVGYTQVRERDLDAAGNDQGYTSYRFSFTGDSLNAVWIWSFYWPEGIIEDPSFPSNTFEYKRGLLLSQTRYKKNGAGYTKIDSLDNKYNFNDFNATNHYYRQRNLRIRQVGFGNWGTPLEESPHYHNPTQGIEWDFTYANYDYITSWVQQISSEQITYDENGTNPLTNLTKFYYDNPAHLMQTRIETTNSLGRKQITYMSYPHDYAAGTTSIDDMVAANIIKPIETLQYQLDGTEILKGTLAVYKTGGKGILDRIKILETPAPIALSGFRFSNTTTGLLPFNTGTRTVLTPDSHYADRVLVNAVDDRGNTNEQQKTDDAKEVYFWGYKGLYPVAKLVGTDYNTAKTYISQSILDNATGNGDDAALQTELNKLRNVPGAQVTTFTYKPLVGITSQTDPAGRTTSYEYDTFNRLKLIRDQDGKIVKQFDYQYNVNP